MGGSSEKAASKAVNRIPLVFRPAAEAELEEAADWYLYEKQSPQAALGFLDEIDTAIERISSEPERGPRYSLGTHRYMLNRYPYMVIYLIKDDSIRVIAVAHTSRRPGYWRERLSED